jgi:hypothetical protein
VTVDAATAVKSAAHQLDADVCATRAHATSAAARGAEITPLSKHGFAAVGGSS